MKCYEQSSAMSEPRFSAREGLRKRLNAMCSQNILFGKLYVFGDRGSSKMRGSIATGLVVLAGVVDL